MFGLFRSAMAHSVPKCIPSAQLDINGDGFGAWRGLKS
jgi:hypothetical protein